MELWKKRILVLLTFLFILPGTVWSLEIFIAPFKVLTPTGEQILDSMGEAKLLESLQNTLTQLSNPELVFKPLPPLSKATLNILKHSYVQTKLEASIVCFYEKIDYLLYGMIVFDKQNRIYSAQFTLYHRDSNSNLRQLSYAAQTDDESAFITQLGQKIATETPQVLSAGSIKERDTATSSSTTTSSAQERNPPPLSKTDTKEATPITTPETTKPAPSSVQTEEKIKYVEAPPRERLIQAIFASGFFFILEHEWMNMVKPFAVLSSGASLELPLIDNPLGFDFSLRASGFLQYAFANAQPNRPYTHFHSLKFKVSLEAYFQFQELFGFFAGAGPFYRLDVIDFATMVNLFFTDHVLALGGYAIVGLELMLNADRTLGIGILNSLDVTFYSQISYEYNLQFYFIFKV